jgi:flavorubredoxin
MAELIAEGVRISGQEGELMKISDIKNADALQGFDAYIFGSPTYHRDMTQGMKTFLFLVQKAGLGGKVGAAFGSSTHSGEAPGLIYDTMEYVFKMKMTSLGSFNMKEDVITTGEGIRACQDYGKAVVEEGSQ